MKIALGLGCDRGTPLATLQRVIDEALASCHAQIVDVAAVASIDLKADEPALLQLAQVHGWLIRFHPANELALVDVDQTMLDLAAQRELPGGQPMTVCQGNVEALPFEAGAFDTVVAQFLFCGVTQPVQGLRECRRVLAPGGRLFLLEHVRSDHCFLGPLLDALNVVTSRLFADRFNQRVEPLLAEAGWRVVRREDLFLDVIRLLEAVPQEEEAAKS